MSCNTDCSPYAMGHYRSRSIRVSLAHCSEIVCLRRFQGLKKGFLAPETDRVGDLAVSMRRRLTTSRHQSFIQIPIARTIYLTTALHPAVSSLEVCRTPAR